jgi:NADP-dependent aldehyde dehydrogenase
VTAFDWPGRVEVVDSHTEGEPTRVVVDGWPLPEGRTMAERRAFLLAHQDRLRQAVVCEPRGHDAVVGALLAQTPAGTMVHAGIKAAYDAELAAVAAIPGVALAARASGRGENRATEAQAALLVADAAAFAENDRLGEEIYGPVTLAVRCGSRDELLAAARRLSGHLTATVHATEADLADVPELLPLLARKAGRVVLNGVPTGVEVTPAMHHGGPWPATTDPRATSVGTAAILRFARPVSYQDVPSAHLPEELQDANPRGIWRLVEGRLTKDPL